MTDASSVAPKRHFPTTPAPRAARPLWERAHARRALGAALVVGLFVDQMVVTDPNGLAGTVTVLVAAAAVTWIVRPRRWAALWLVLACALAPWFAVRVSPWLVLPNAAAVVSLFLLAVSGPTTIASFFDGVGRVASSLPASMQTPSDVGAAARAAVPSGPPERRSALARGVLIAAPLVIVTFWLLVSGDRFFASLIGTNGFGSALSHILVSLVGSLLWFSLVVRHRLLQPVADAEQRGRRLAGVIGVHESTVILGALSCLLSVYVASTLTAALSGRSYVQARTGLTYAQYARSGFFQLVAVAVIVIAVLVTLRPVIDGTKGRRRVLVLGEILAALTIVVVGVSVARLQTYRGVYGLTMLRFFTTAFALWLGVVLVLVAASLFIARLRPALVGVVIVSGCVALLGTNVVNPEAIVARENILRVGSVTSSDTTFDGVYLAESLSDDAVPTIVANLDRLSPQARRTVLGFVCGSDTNDQGWSLSLARSSAEDARRTVCR
jgi:Domain of unknown function (DUF4173)